MVGTEILKFPERLCTIPCKIVWYSREIDENTGMARKIDFVYEGKCCLRRKKEFVRDKNSSGNVEKMVAVLCGKVVPTEEFSYGEIEFLGTEKSNIPIGIHGICAVKTGYGTDGSVHHTQLELE